MGYVGKPLHVGISVLDMEEALGWYERNLGFRLVKDCGFLDRLGARICFVESDGFQLELFQYQSPNPIPPERLHPNTDLQTVGTKHLALSVADMAETRKRLTASGVSIVHEATMDRDLVIFIRDCCGTLIELIQQNAL
jgi:catechol 2,3-dioxygenase-like lactoylglutathione lyase family enzyme